MATLNTKIVLLNGVKTEWDKLQNHVLSRGEPAVEFVPNIGSDLKAVKVKIGDGFTTYANLPYIGSEIVDEITNAGYQNVEQVSNAIVTALADYYNKDAIDSKIQTLEKADNDLSTAIKTAQAAAENAQKDIDTFMGTIASDTAAIDTLNEVIALIESEDAEISSALLAEIDGLKEKFNSDGKALEAVNAETLDGKDSSYFATSSALNDLTASYTGIANIIGDSNNGLIKDVAELKAIDHDKIAKDAAKAAIDAHNIDKNHLTSTDVDNQIDAKLATADYVGKIAVAKDEAIAAALIKSVDENQFTVTDGKLNLNDIAQDKITGLAETFANIYTKEEVDAAIDADVKVISDYVGTIPSDDKYKDITNVIAYINKKAEETLAAANGESGETADSVALALENYKLENDPKVKKNTEDIIAINARLDTIEENAGECAIESITIGGVALAITDKVVDIPTATSEKFGVIKLGDEFQTNEDGALEVKEINVNKLVQDDGDVLILNGGLATNLISE